MITREQDDENDKKVKRFAKMMPIIRIELMIFSLLVRRFTIKPNGRTRRCTVTPSRRRRSRTGSYTVLNSDCLYDATKQRFQQIAAADKESLDTLSCVNNQTTTQVYMNNLFKFHFYTVHNICSPSSKFLIIASQAVADSRCINVQKKELLIRDRL